jgi:hypothetical protein
MVSDSIGEFKRSRLLFRIIFWYGKRNLKMGAPFFLGYSEILARKNTVDDSAVINTIITIIVSNSKNDHSSLL